MRLMHLALAAAGLAMASGCASSATSSRSNEPIRALLSADTMLFVGFDSDDNLSITGAEIDAGIEREFARADTSGDGELSPLEFQTWSQLALGGTQLGPFRLDFDRNVDNRITREEFNNEIRGRVSDYDEDGDGVLSRAEFVRLVGQARPPTQRRRSSIMMR